MTINKAFSSDVITHTTKDHQVYLLMFVEVFDMLQTHTQKKGETKRGEDDKRKSKLIIFNQKLS